MRKKVIIGLGVLVILAVIALLAAPAFIYVNHYRPQIESKLRYRLGPRGLLRSDEAQSSYSSRFRSKPASSRCADLWISVAPMSFRAGANSHPDADMRLWLIAIWK